MTIGKHIDDLGTRALTWRDLKVVVMCAPPQGALHRVLDPEGWGWTPDTYLSAAIVDLTQVANWQRAGDKRQRKPEPVLRPGQKPKKKRVRSLTAAALEARGTTSGS